MKSEKRLHRLREGRTNSNRDMGVRVTLKLLRKRVCKPENICRERERAVAHQKQNMPAHFSLQIFSGRPPQ